MLADWELGPSPPSFWGVGLKPSFSWPSKVLLRMTGSVAAAKNSASLAAALPRHHRVYSGYSGKVGQY